MTLRHIILATTVLITSGLSHNAFASPVPPEPALHNMQEPRRMKMNDAETGALMFRTDIQGQYIEAPMISTDVNMSISGPVIRTTLSQTFENKSDKWVEGVYVFPLPENAAVDRLRMVVGGRLIEGQINEKKQAKKIYEQAKAEGKKASLVEQLRPNMFTASVANIGPYEKVAIQIEYQDKAQIKNGIFAARFPMTVAPRFSPPAVPVQVATTEGIETLVLDPVLDRKAISPPFKSAAQEPVEYIRLPVSLNINLDAGFDISQVSSPYHAITTSRIDEDSVHIKLAEGRVPANRDFLLEWRAQETREPYSALFKQTLGEDTYLLSMLTPSISETSEAAYQARESIFVIDTSGSMGGTSIAQAREALLLALDHLREGDTFNIIRFASKHTSFESVPIPATQRNIKLARRWVRELMAHGGTNMSPALSQALKVNTASDDKTRLRQVVFITDGAIGNERQLFAQIQDQLGETRLFPVGIGSAPNGYFMSRAAKFGRGSFVQIGDISEVSKRMGTLFAAIDSPVLTNLSSSAQGASFPSRLPDVYKGSPVISIAKVKTEQLPETLSLSGNLADAPWQETKSLSEAQEANGLSVLWARAKIADLEESRFDRAGAATIDQQILQTALDHHIVSRLTSLVAVDITPSRPSGEGLHSAKVPTMLPEGWTFGQLAANEAAQRQLPPSGPSLSSPSSAPQSLRLPNTASPHVILGYLGGLLLLLGAALRHLARRRFI